MLGDTARKLCGTVQADLPDMGKVDVEIGSDFVRESRKYIFNPKTKRARPLSEQREIASRQLEAMSHIDDLLKGGKTNGWVHHEGHHPENDYLTLFKRFPYKGKSRIFTLDIKRPAGGSDQGVQAHNMSAEGNPGFETKVRKLGIKDAAPRVAILRVQML